MTPPFYWALLMLHLLVSLPAQECLSNRIMSTSLEECDAPDMCCEFSPTQAIFGVLASQFLMQTRDLQERILNTSSAISLSPGAKVVSLASGGANFTVQLLFGQRVDTKVAKVEMSIRRNSIINSSVEVASQLCRLSCSTGINRVICPVPGILSLLSNETTTSLASNGSVYALPLNRRGFCSAGPTETATVALCYELNIDGKPVVFPASEARGVDLSSLLNGALSPDIISQFTKSASEMIIYVPDPVVLDAARISTNLVVIKGIGLHIDDSLEAKFDLTLSVQGIPGFVSCLGLHSEDPYYLAHINETYSSESVIICLFSEKELNKLLERARPKASNNTSVLMTATVSAGFYRGTAQFNQKLPPATPTGISDKLLIVAITVPITCSVGIILAVIVLCFIRWSSGKRLFPQKGGCKHFPDISICFGEQQQLRSSQFSMSPSFTNEMFTPEVAEIIQNRRISNQLIRFGADIGNGHFGIVKRGTLQIRGNNGERSEQEVAVKFIQNCTSRKELKEFFQEAVRMFSFDHPNVLSAYGIVSATGEGYPALVLPLMDVGDLRKFVQSASARITDLLIVDFASQITKGMTYLAGKSFIHRDLAARNCLLNKHRVVKIADFGLSRLATNTDYEYVPIYETQVLRRPLPIRWMAPECIDSGVFSEKTDVWSFGVLLWELATRGQRPYTTLETPVEVIRHVCVGNGRLPQQPTISDSFYRIMTSCWQDRPSERPTFQMLSEISDQLLSDVHGPLYADDTEYRDNPQEDEANGYQEIQRLVHGHFLEALETVLQSRQSSGESNGTTHQHAPIPSRHDSGAVRSLLNLTGQNYHATI